MPRTDVVLLSGSFWPREGGAEKQLRQVLDELHSRGMSVAVVSQVLRGKKRSEAAGVAGGIRVVRAGSLAAFSYAPRVGQMLFLASAVFHAVRLRPRAIISLQLGSATAAAAIAARALRAKHIVRLTGGGTAAHRSEALARSAKLGGRVLVLLALSGHDKWLVSPALHLLRDFESAFPRVSARLRLQVIPNGVNRSPRVLDQPTSRRGVVWYARAGSERSMQFFTGVAGRCPDIQFEVIGQRIGVQELSNVRLHGWVDDVDEVLGSARVLLNTSLNEGMPNMALQALANGCLVVGFANPGIRELRGQYPGHVTIYEDWSARAAAEAVQRVMDKEIPTESAQITSVSEASSHWLRLLEG